jgi:hypothetical protein
LSYGFFRGVGDIQTKIQKHADRFGYLIVQDKNRKNVLSRVKKALKIIKIIVL